MDNRHHQPERTRVKIRVKEKVSRGDEERQTVKKGERALLIILGAILGLGIGYLVAGKLFSYLRPVGVGIGRVDRSSSGRVATDEPATPLITDIEFDLP